MRVRRIASLAVLCVATVASAEVIELTTGNRIEGEVLKNGADVVVIDIGVEILKIPIDKIKSRSGEFDKQPQETKIKRGDLYDVAKLPPRNVKELANEYGDGVVLIQTPGGLGSGFIVTSRGHCVTNYHVIERESRIAVSLFLKEAKGGFARRRVDNVQIVATNPFLDLALLQIPEQKDLPFKTVMLSEADDQKEGEEVFAIGNPLGLERSVSKGIISTRNRNRDCRPLQVSTRRQGALDLRGRRGSGAISQRIRRRRPGVPEDCPPAAARADRIGAAVRGCTGHCARALRRRRGPGSKEIPSGRAVATDASSYPGGAGDAGG